MSVAKPRLLHGRSAARPSGQPTGRGPALPVLCIGALPTLLAAALAWMPGHAVDVLNHQQQRRADSMLEAAIHGADRAMAHGSHGFSGEAQRLRVQGWDCVVSHRINPEDSGDGSWLLAEVTEPGTTRRGKFRFPSLLGAAPAAFAMPFLHVKAKSHGEAWPTLDLDALQRGAKASAALPWLQDAGALANRHVPGGTDLRDWQFAGQNEGPVRLSKILGDARHSAVLVVDGNLWIDGGGEPMVIQTDHAVTVVVQGNLWMLDSLVVCGTGHLTLAVVERSPMLAATAPVEGQGGLTIRTRKREDVGPNQLCQSDGQSDVIPRCDANLVVEGRLLVAGAGMLCRGSLMVRGAIEAEAGAPLEATGERLLDPFRDSVPGFVVTGEPRPGRVRTMVDPMSRVP